jgi:dTDP-L-rhamnose 4-epimerase
MNKKVLITGGAGFIGSNLAIKLHAIGYEVVVLDNLNPQVHGDKYNNSFTYQIIKNKVQFIKGSILSDDEVLQALKGVDIVVHMAAETGTGQSMYEVSLHTDVNINGLAKLYEVIVKNKLHVEKIILPSSRSVYGEGKYHCLEHGFQYPLERDESNLKHKFFDFTCGHCGEKLKPVATDEGSKINFRSVYGFTKYSQEELAKLMSKILDIPTDIYRLQNVYGVGQSLSNPYTGIISIFSNLIKNNNQINIFEDGLESRDFINVEDVTDVIVRGISNKTSGCDIYNIGTGISTSVMQIVKLLSEVIGIEPTYVISGNYRAGDIRHNYADINKLRRDLKIEPKIELREGIKKLVNWIEQNDFPCGYESYERSLNEIKKFNLYK